jgi:Thioredoxin like C-terminal domain
MGMPRGADHGVEVDANGDGIIKGQRLYQLVRLPGDVTDHTFEIHFLGSGATASTFTFR